MHPFAQTGTHFARTYRTTALHCARANTEQGEMKIVLAEIPAIIVLRTVVVLQHSNYYITEYRAIIFGRVHAQINARLLIVGQSKINDCRQKLITIISEMCQDTKENTDM